MRSLHARSTRPTTRAAIGPRAVAVVAAAALAASAASIALAGPPSPSVDIFDPVADTSIFDVGEVSNGAGAELRAGVTNSGGGFTIQRSPIRFDLSRIPDGAVVLQASLTLRLMQAGGQAMPGDQFQLRRVLSPWGEAGSVATGGQGAPAEPGDATWTNAFFPDVPWATPGGDLAAAISAQTAIGTVVNSTWTFTGAQLEADIAEWIADPAGNHGWMLLGDETDTGNARRFGSREGTPVQWPMLAVTWTVPPPCPGDLDASGSIDFGDVLAVLAGFGRCDGCPEDLDGNGVVEFDDLLELLSAFGGCLG